VIEKAMGVAAFEMKCLDFSFGQCELEGFLVLVLFLLAVLGFEFKASCLLDRYSTT
jgi:hypothetical protein